MLMVRKLKLYFPKLYLSKWVYILSVDEVQAEKRKRLVEGECQVLYESIGRAPGLDDWH